MSTSVDEISSISALLPLSLGISSKKTMSSLNPFFSTDPRNHVYNPFTPEFWDPFCDVNYETPLSAPHIPFHNNITSIGGTQFKWQEMPEAHVLRAELPGLGKEEMKVQVEEGKVLKISGKKKVEKEEKHENWHHLEYSNKNFLSEFSLPENSRPDDVKASLENEVLTITVPKREVGKSHVKNIEVMG